MAVDLVFAAGLADTISPVDLVFGANTTGQGLQFAIVLPPPTAALVVEVQATPVEFHAFLAGPTASFAVQYDANTPIYLEAHATAPWRDGAAARALPGTSWSSGVAVAAGKALPWRDAAPVFSVRASLPWQDCLRLTARASTPWRDGTALRPSALSAPWRDGTALRPSALSAPWRDAADVAHSWSAPWRDADHLRFDRLMPWRDGARSQHAHVLAWRQGRLATVPDDLPWRDGARLSTRGGNAFPVVVVPPYDPCYLPPLGTAVNLLFRDPLSGSTTTLVFTCTRHPPLLAATVTVPIRKVYVVINNTHLIKLAGMVELNVLNMQLSLDADSWTWGFSATLPADQLSLVLPASDGTPVMLAAVVNGVSYYVVAESINRDRSFNQATIRLSGRGKNAMLDAPYALTQSFGNTAARTAVQLLDAALTLNNVSIGWTVESGLTDWLIPAGAWSHVGSHMSAALSVAGAVGGYIQPHPTADTLRVLSRYPSAPWEWGAVTPDFELPSAVVRHEGISWLEKARYNRVFVSGEGQGVLCQVTRAGTAGDVVAPMVTDPLITQAAAGRQRGTAILADTGRIAKVSLALPVLAETGIITPGKFVRYTDGAVTRLGLVRGTSVDVALPEVWQTLEVETHE